MTFEALHNFIKKNDVLSLRRELDGGVSANLSNQFSWTLLMLTLMQQMILEKHHSHWRRTKAILHSSETYSPVALRQRAALMESTWETG